MFRIGDAGADPDLIQSLADGFTWWTNLRAASAGVAAAALLYALTLCALQTSYPASRSSSDLTGTGSARPAA
jgi:hypothetical protein